MKDYMKNTEKLQSHLFPSGGFRGARWGDRTPLRENFFDFSQQKRTKNKFVLLRMHLKMCYLPMIASPFQNPRSATGLDEMICVNKCVEFYSYDY